MSAFHCGAIQAQALPQPPDLVIAKPAYLALVKVMRRGGVMEFSDYKKFSVDTSTSLVRPKTP